MNEFKFFVITDTHFFKNSLGAYGPGYDRFMETEQKCFAETEAIDKAVFKYLEESKDADTILIAGDLTFWGEKESHAEYINMLRQLKASGKRILVVTAGHDISDHPFCFPGTEDRIPVEGIKFDDLYDLYSEFGYADALSFNRKHMSYVTQLTDGVRLLVMCGDTAYGHNVEYDDEFLSWVKVQLDDARIHNQTVFAMEHYPVIAGQPVLSFISDARVKKSKKLIGLLADNGCHLIFTGHMHNQSINVAETALGNKFYDVCTGSVIGCPAYIRLCTVKDKNTVQINSIPIPEFDWDKKGLTGEEYLKKQFDSMIINLITGLKTNPGKTLRKIDMRDTELNKKIFGKLGTKISEATLGDIAKLLRVKIDSNIKDNSFLQFMTDIVRNIFCGDQPYTDSTPEGKFFLSLIKKLGPALGIINSKVHDCQGETIDIYEVLKHSIGNYGISDYDAVLNLK